MRVILFVLALAACGPTSYGSATRAKPMGRGRFLITVEGRRIGSGLALEYIDRKARELCGGDYEIESQTGGETSRTWQDPSTGKVRSKQRTDASAVVRCR